MRSVFESLIFESIIRSAVAVDIASIDFAKDDTNVIYKVFSLRNTLRIALESLR